jgi:hypothetical protein
LNFSIHFDPIDCSLIVIESGGWIDLMPVETAELLVLPPEEVQVWQRVARGVERLLGHVDHKKTATLP